MLTVCGIVYLTGQSSEHPCSNGVYFKFRAVGKHPRKGEHTYYNLNIFVPTEKLGRAREILVANKHVWIRIGELEGRKLGDNLIVNPISTSWDKIEILNRALPKEKQ